MKALDWCLVVSASVSTVTEFVVAGESVGSKLDNERELGVAILDEAEFRQRLGLPVAPPTQAGLL